MENEKDKNIEVVVVRSPLDRTNKIQKTIAYNKQTVYEIVKENIPEVVENIVVSINGKIIEEEKWNNTYAIPDDFVLLVPVLGDLDINTIISIVAFAVLMAYAPGLAGVLSGAEAGFAYQLTYMGIVVGGAMLINSLAPAPSMPSLSGGFGADADLSQFFSFNPATKQREGGVLPMIFGRMKCYGNIISANTELSENNDKQILNLLIALSHGPIKGIVDAEDTSGGSIYGQVKINNQPVENFQDVTIVNRVGDLNQEIIPFFNDLLNETTTEQLVSSDNPVNFTTTGGNFDEIEVKLASPGIYYQNDQNGFDKHTIDLKIEIKKTTDSSYKTLFNGSIKDDRNSLVKRTYRSINNDDIDIENGSNYDIRVTKVSEDEDGIRYGDKIYLNSVGEILLDDFIYPLVALTAVKSLASDQLSGSIDFSAVLDGKICRVWDGESWKNEFSDNPSWILFNVISSPIFSGNAETGYTVARYDGVNPDQIDTESFYELANYCNESVPINIDNPSDTERRFVWNGGFDSSSSVWKSALICCKMCRSTLIFSGTTISVITDKPTPVTAQFNMANIVKDSFKEDFPPYSDRASEIQINYIDADQDYVKTTFTVFNTSIPNNSNRVSIDLHGVTSGSQAYREGIFLLSQNQLLYKTLEFKTGIDSLSVQVGDVFIFSHDVPLLGQSGRLIGVGINSVLLSEDFIDYNPSETENYIIKIRLKDDTIITKTVLEFENNRITFTEPFDQIPDVNDIYQIGTSEKINNKFRVIEITRSGEQNALIRAIEYVEEIYDSTDLGAKLPVSDDMSFIIDPNDELVTDVNMSEEVIILESGVVQRNIIITYDLPSTGSFYRAQIYARVEGTSWGLVGETISDKFIFAGVLENTKYEIKIITQLNDLKTSAFINSPGGFFTTGSIDEFSDQLLRVVLTGLQIEGSGSTTEFVGKDCAFKWEPIPNPDINPSFDYDNPSVEYSDIMPSNFISDYEVKIYDSVNGVLRRIEYILEPRYTYTHEINYIDGGDDASRNLRIEVKVRDKWGRIGVNPATIIVSNPIPPKLTGIADVELSRASEISWTASGVIDLANYKLWASTVSPVDTSDDDDLVYRGPDTSFTFAPGSFNTYYYKVAACDTFDEDITAPDQYSTTIAETTLTADIPLPSGIVYSSELDLNPSVFTLNPSNLYVVSWSSGTIQYKGVTYNISGGETTELRKFVFWDPNFLNTEFQTTDILDEILVAKAWVMAVVDNGIVFPTFGVRSLHAGVLRADTVLAEHISVDSLAAINADLGTITAGNISALSLDADSITAGTILADRIEAATIIGCTTNIPGGLTKEYDGNGYLTGAGGGGWYDSDKDTLTLENAIQDVQITGQLIATTSGSYYFYIKTTGGTLLWQSDIKSLTSANDNEWHSSIIKPFAIGVAEDASFKVGIALNMPGSGTFGFDTLKIYYTDMLDKDLDK